MREDLHEGTIPERPEAFAPPTRSDEVTSSDFLPTEPARSSSFEGLDSRPHSLDERGYQVSFDGQFWWNGATWVPGQPPGKQPFPIAGTAPTKVQAAIAIGGLLLFAGFAFSVCQSMPGSGFPSP